MKTLNRATLVYLLILGNMINTEIIKDIFNIESILISSLIISVFFLFSTFITFINEIERKEEVKEEKTFNLTEQEKKELIEKVMSKIN